MKVWLYPGSFDPVTLGHLEIIKRAAALCDELIVGVFDNMNKNAAFTPAERAGLIERCIKEEGLKNVKTVLFGGLLAAYVGENSISAIVKGLRNTTDFEYEHQMAQLNRHLCDRAESVFLLSDGALSCISSSAVKDIAAHGGSIRGLVPDYLIETIQKRFI